jgi:hypothetical protein
LISSILVALSGVSEKKAGSMPPANKMMLKTLDDSGSAKD